MKKYLEYKFIYIYIIFEKNNETEKKIRFWILEILLFSLLEVGKKMKKNSELEYQIGNIL